MADAITPETSERLATMLKQAGSLLAQGYSQKAITYACVQAATLIRQQHDRIAALEEKLSRLNCIAMDLQHTCDQTAMLNGKLQVEVARLTAERDAAETRAASLVTACLELQRDMLFRSRAGMDVIHGQKHRIVNAGSSVWSGFCRALGDACALPLRDTPAPEDSHD